MHHQVFVITVAVFLAGTGLTFTSAQIPFLGSCANSQPKQDFQLDKYLGRWYEYARYFAIFELGAGCVTADYSLNDNGTVKVVNSQINTYTKKPVDIQGYATVDSSTGEGKLRVYFPTVPGPAGTDGAPYWVLDTDYENYSVVWSCSNFSVLNLQFAWLLTRAEVPSQDVLNQAYAVVDKFQLNRNLLMKTAHANCTK